MSVGDLVRIAPTYGAWAYHGYVGIIEKVYIHNKGSFCLFREQIKGWKLTIALRDLEKLA